MFIQDQNRLNIFLIVVFLNISFNIQHFLAKTQGSLPSFGEKKKVLCCKDGNDTVTHESKLSCKKKIEFTRKMCNSTQRGKRLCITDGIYHIFTPDLSSLHI